MAARNIADDHTAIGEGLARIEQERLRRFNPPLIFEPYDNAGDFAWEVIQSGRLQQTEWWCASDEQATRAHFVLVDTPVQAFVIWINGQGHDELRILAKRPFSYGSGQSVGISNLKRLFSRLRILDVI